MNFLQSHAFACTNNSTGILRLKDIFKNDSYVPRSIAQHALNALLLVISNELCQVVKNLPLRSCQHGLDYGMLFTALQNRSVSFAEFIANLRRSFVVFFVD